jgi:hypothetical protein
MPTSNSWKFLLSSCALITLVGLGCQKPTASNSSPTSNQPAVTSNPAAGATVVPRTCANGLCFYENKKELFTAQYPQGWDVREGSFGTIVSFLSPLTDKTDQFSENVNVVDENLGSQKISLADYYKASEDNLKKYFTDFKTLRNDATTLGGYPARIIVYTATQNGDANSTVPPIKLRTTQIFTIKDNKAYILTLTNTQDKPDTYYPEMLKIAESFNFTK